MKQKIWGLALLAAALILSTTACSARTSQSVRNDPTTTNEANLAPPDLEPAPALPKKPEPEPEGRSDYQGTFLIPDTQLQITIKSPFEAVHSVVAANLTVTIPDDPSLQGYLFYTKGTETLKAMIENMDAANRSDPTVTEFQKDIQEQSDGTNIYTFTYSAGEAEGSPAGFYYARFQETADGFLTVQFTCPKINYKDQIMTLFDSIATADSTAKEAPVS